jgi:hypothetical protein
VEAMLSQVADRDIVEDVVDRCDDWRLENGSESRAFWAVECRVKEDSQEGGEDTKDDQRSESNGPAGGLIMKKWLASSLLTCV